MAGDTQKRIAVRWIRSGIAFNRSQKEAIRSLGLRRLRHTVVRDDTPVVRGLIAKVAHLVEVVERPAGPPPAALPEYTIVPAPAAAPPPEKGAASAEPAAPAKSAGEAAAAPEAASEAAPAPRRRARRPKAESAGGEAEAGAAQAPPETGS